MNLTYKAKWLNNQKGTTRHLQQLLKIKNEFKTYFSKEAAHARNCPVIPALQINFKIIKIYEEEGEANLLHMKLAKIRMIANVAQLHNRIVDWASLEGQSVLKGKNTILE